MPLWSDEGAGEEPAAPQGAAYQDAARGSEPAPGEEPGQPSCAWCGTPAAPDATRCASCGAALAQREAIGDLVIPGLTAVDPALQDLDGRPLHISGPSPSQGAASGIVAAAAMGGPLGLAILGGVGAIAAAEYLGASKGKRAADGRDVGQVSEAVQQALERLERAEPAEPPSESEPGDR